MQTTKEEWIRVQMHKHREITNNYGWPWLDEPGMLSMKNANKFLLGARIDYQISADKAWENAGILAETVLGDPDDLWIAIMGMGNQGLKNAFGGVHKARGCNRCTAGHKMIEPKDSGISRHNTLHRFPNKAADGVWKLAQTILKRYGGDARKIWTGRPTEDILDRLADVGFGSNMSCMVVGALLDTERIEGTGSLKADINVCRVLGRVFLGKRVQPTEAHRIAETIEPDNTWSMDGVLYALGRENCTATNPDCCRCFLKTKCEYYARHSY